MSFSLPLLPSLADIQSLAVYLLLYSVTLNMILFIIKLFENSNATPLNQTRAMLYVGLGFR